MKNLKKIARLLLVVFTLSCLSSSANAGLIAGALGGGIVKKKPSFMGKVVKQLAIGTVVVGGAYLLNKKLQEQEEIKRQEAIEEQLKRDQQQQELERQNVDRSTPPFIADTTNNSIPETVASDNEESIPPSLPWRDGEQPDQEVEGFDTHIDLEGIPGLYWEGMTAEDIIIAKRDSKILGDNLVRNGEVRNKGDSAHHIIEAGRDNLEAKLSRDILKKFGIDINDAVNGVFLHSSRNGIPTGDIRTPHPDTLLQKFDRDGKPIVGYSKWIYKQIQKIKTKKELMGKLIKIKDVMLKGETPWIR